MADTRDRPLGHDPDRVTPEFELRSNGHKADVSAVEPFAEEIEIHRKEILDGEGACGLGVQEGALEVEAETERIRRFHGSLGGLQIARDPCSDQSFRRIDMEIDEPRKDDLIAARVPVFDLDDEVSLDRQRARSGATDRVNEKSL